MTSNQNILLEHFLLEFAYKFTDKFENELYIFKVAHDAEEIKIKKEIKKMKKDNLTLGFFYEKEGDLYIKVKKRQIKKLNKFNFEKSKAYRTHLNLIYYDYNDKKGFCASMTETEESKEHVFSDSD